MGKIFDRTPTYNPLNLSIEEQRKYNMEKYHFLSGILDIIIFHFQVERGYHLTLDNIYKHFRNHKLKTEREREKFNAAIAQLVGSEMIEINAHGIVGLTDKGINAYDCQLFHGIAANLYAADRAEHLAKVAIKAASILSVIAILCTIFVPILKCL